MTPSDPGCLECEEPDVVVRIGLDRQRDDDSLQPRRSVGARPFRDRGEGRARIGDASQAEAESEREQYKVLRQVTVQMTSTTTWMMNRPSKATPLTWCKPLTPPRLVPRPASADPTARPLAQPPHRRPKEHRQPLPDPEGGSENKLHLPARRRSSRCGIAEAAVTKIERGWLSVITISCPHAGRPARHAKSLNTTGRRGQRHWVAGSWPCCCWMQHESRSAHHPGGGRIIPLPPRH